MTVDTDVVIKNNTNGYWFNFRGVNNWKVKKSQGVISIPIINQTAQNNALFRFMGQTEEVNFSFALFNDGTDCSGTSAFSIVTIDQQIQYLKDSVYTADFDCYWNLKDNAGRYYTAVVTGVINDIDFDQKSGSPTLVLGNFSMLLGTIIDMDTSDEETTP